MRLMIAVLVVASLSGGLMGCGHMPGGDYNSTTVQKAEAWFDEIDLLYADVEAYLMYKSGDGTSPDALREAQFFYGIAKRRIL